LHSRLQILLSDHLRDHLDHGERFVELAIETADGTKVADVAWMSADRYASIPVAAEPTPQAPEICVEVRSTTNTDEEMAEKRALYFDAGAEEVWICDEDGRIAFYHETGEVDASGRVPTFPHEIAL
jgi:Uma2 family endonuclease